MRIGLVTTWGRRCGLSCYAENLAAHLLARGHSVWVLDEVQEKETLREGLPPVNHRPCWYPPDPSWNILQACTHIDPDVLFWSHDWDWMEANIFQRVIEGTTQMGIPLVVGWHNLLSCRSPLQEVPGAAGHIVYHPRASAHLASLGQPAAQITYIPHVCPSEPAVPTRDRDAALRVATLGLLYPSKGADQLVTAVHHASRILGRPALLDIYSCCNAWTLSDYEKHVADVEALVRRLGMEDQVSLWNGFPSEAGLVRALARADLVALLYRHVPFRLTGSAALATAFAAARPLVVSDIPHFELDDPVANLLMRAQDPVEAGEMMAYLFREPEEAKDRGRAAADYALAWGPEPWGTAHEQVFQRVAAARQGGYREMPRIGVVVGRHTPLGHTGLPENVVGFPVQRVPLASLNEGVAALDPTVEWVQFLREDHRLLNGWDVVLGKRIGDGADLVRGETLEEGGERVAGLSAYCVRRSLVEEMGFEVRDDDSWETLATDFSRRLPQGTRVERAAAPTVSVGTVTPAERAAGRARAGRPGSTISRRDWQKF